MLSGLAGAGTKALGGARFSLVSVVPSAFLVGFVTLLAVSGLYDGRHPHLMATIQSLGHNIGWSVVAVFGVFLLAVLLRPFQAAVVQLLEGYWQGIAPFSQLRALAVERHRRIQHTALVTMEVEIDPDPLPAQQLREFALRQRQARRRARAFVKADQRFDRYPRPLTSMNEDGEEVEEERLMPTLLGNVLRDGEDNAGQRYGLTFQVIAPRLYPALSEKLRNAITQNLDLIDITAAMCVAFAAATVAALPLIGRWDVWSWLPGGTALLAVLAYRGAIRTARGHARLLATAVDLHRFDMLTSLHYRLPVTVQQERKFNRRLSEFLDSHEPAVDDLRMVRYQHQITDSGPKK